MAEYDINWVAQVIDKERIGYALTGYFDAEDILDPELRKLCIEAEAAIRSVEEYIEENRTDD